MAILSEKLDLLAKQVVELMTFSFERKDIPFSEELLISNKILIEEKNVLVVADSKLFTEAFYRILASKLSFKQNKDFLETMDFYERVNKEFIHEKKTIIGLTKQLRNLLTFLIILANREYGESFEKYIVTLNKNGNWKYFYDFLTSFALALDKLSIPPPSLNRSLIHLYNQLDTEVYYNFDLSELLKGIQEFCRINPAEGEKLLLLQKENEQLVINIYSAILSGLYKSDRKSGIERLREVSKDQKDHISIAIIASSLNPENDEEAMNIIKLLKDINSDSEDFVIQLPRVYVNIIRNENCSKKTTINTCFNSLQKILKTEHLGIKQNTLWHLHFIDGHDGDLFRILDSLNEHELDDSLLENVNHVLRKFEDQKYYFQFLRRYSEKNGLKFDSKSFELSIIHFINANSPEFGNYLLRLLIDDNGLIRFTGHRILSHLCIIMSLNNSRLDWNILSLLPIEQYKLWVSVLQNSLEPKYALPLLLPLRNSKNSLIVEQFSCKLEELVENYSSPVIEVLKEHLDLENRNDKNLLIRIEHKRREFSEYRNRKLGIKELDPSYTQTKLFEIYRENYSTRFSTNMDDSVKKNSSILSMLTTVTLAKGGGWKHEKEGQISQLSTFSSSFQFPRFYYIMPEKFDFDNQIGYTENWDEKFKQWEATISSFENT